MASTFWQSQLAAVEVQLGLYNDAINALVVQGVESYTLDTNQSRQVVTKLDIDKLQKTYDSLLNRYSTLEARCTGSNSVTMRPCW